MKKFLALFSLLLSVTSGQAQNNVITPNAGDLIQLVSPLRNNGSLTYTTPTLLGPVTSSLAIGTTPITGGATTQVLFNNAGVIGSDAGLTKAAGASGAVTLGGPLIVNSTFQMGAANIITWNGRAVMSSPADSVILLQNNAGSTFGQLQLGGTTSSFPSLKRNAAALEFRLADDSASTSFVATTGILNAIATDSGQTATATVCEDTTTHQLYFGSGAAGVCKGTSSARFKDAIKPLVAGLDEIMNLASISYYLKPEYGDPSRKLYGFTAEQMFGAIPDLVWLDKEGRPSSVDYVGLVPVLVRAIQQQEVEINDLKRRIQAWAWQP